MTLPVQTRRYSVEEYLQMEENSEDKHEYWDGIIVPLSELLSMAGGTTHTVSLRSTSAPS